MPTIATVTQQLDNDQFLITANISPGELPVEIFIYENTGTTQLGNYVGVCNVDELTRLQVFTGTVIPIFGNKYVRSNSAKIITNTQTDTSTVVAQLVSNIKALTSAYRASQTITQTFTV